MSFNASDLSEKFDLDDPDQFDEASKQVAKHIADTFGDDFARREGDKVFVTTEVLSVFAQADVVNGIDAGLAGQTDTAVMLFKSAVALGSVAEEAKSRV